MATEWQERPACESLQRTDSVSVSVSVGHSPLVCFSRTALSPGFPLDLSELGHLSGTAAVEPSLSQMCRMLGCAQRHGHMCTCVHKPPHFFLPGQLTGGSLWEEVGSARGGGSGGAGPSTPQLASGCTQVSPSCRTVVRALGTGAAATHKLSQTLPRLSSRSGAAAPVENWF